MGYTQFPANIDPVKEYNSWFTVRYGVRLFKMDDQLQIQPLADTKSEQLSSLEWGDHDPSKCDFMMKSYDSSDGQESLEHAKPDQRAAGELMIEQITATDHTLPDQNQRASTDSHLNLLADPYSTILHVGAKGVD